MPPFWENLGSNVGSGSSAEVAVVSRAPGSLTVIVNEAAGDYRMLAREFTGGNWAASWDDLGSAKLRFNKVLSGQNGPAAIVRPDAYIDAFAVAIDGTILHNPWDPHIQKWRGLRQLNTAPAGPLELISVGSWIATEIFIRGGEAKHAYYLARAQQGSTWRSLGGALKWGPVVVARPNERIDLFGVGVDSKLMHKWSTQYLNWKPGLFEWAPLGFEVNERPTVVRVSSTDLHVFAPGPGSAGTRHWRLNGDQWTTETPLEGAGANHIRAVSWGPDRIDLFARNAGLGGSVFHRAWNAGQWSPAPDEPWENLGGDFYSSRPAVPVSWGPNRLDVFIIAEPDTDEDGNVWHRWWDGAQWMPSS